VAEPLKPNLPTAHPLVAALGGGLGYAGAVKAIQKSADLLWDDPAEFEQVRKPWRVRWTQMRTSRRTGAGAPDAGTDPVDPGPAPAKGPDDVTKEDNRKKVVDPSVYDGIDGGDVKDFGAAQGSVELRSFTGYLGGRWTRGTKEWQLLFVDSNLRDWIMMRADQIVYWQRVDDNKAACGKRDYIWLQTDAQVGRGSTLTYPEALFINGGFTAAGDFAASMRGDTWSSDNSLFGEATTPGCCTGKSH
jgi:hypothetical protein